MSVTRRVVFEQLAAASDATRRETATVEALAATLDAGEHVVKSHIEGLEDCDLARRGPDGTARVTITGEELLALDTDEMVIVDAPTPDPET
jgi:hypothetical protein